MNGYANVRMYCQDMGNIDPNCHSKYRHYNNPKPNPTPNPSPAPPDPPPPDPPPPHPSIYESKYILFGIAILILCYIAYKYKKNHLASNSAFASARGGNNGQRSNLINHEPQIENVIQNGTTK